MKLMNSLKHIKMFYNLTVFNQIAQRKNAIESQHLM